MTQRLGWLLLCVLASPAFTQEAPTLVAGGEARKPTVAQTLFLDARPDWRVAWNPGSGTPARLYTLEAGGSLREGAFGTPETVARAFLEETRVLFRLPPGAAEAWRVLAVLDDTLGFTHVRLQQRVGGVPVEGGEVLVHLSGRASDLFHDVVGVAGDVFPGLEGRTADPATPRFVGISEARLATGLAGRLSETPTADLVWLPPPSGRGARGMEDPFSDAELAWRITLKALPGVGGSGGGPAGEPTMPVVYVAADGKPRILERREGLMTDGPTTASGDTFLESNVPLGTYLFQGKYYLYDVSNRSYVFNEDQGNTWATSTNNQWPDEEENAAQYYQALTYSYFKENHGWQGYNGQNAFVRGTVNYGSNYNNAFFDGQSLYYGDGDGWTFSNLAGARDVCAHEWSHGVTTATSNLTYSYQSGALNESMSDVWAVMVDTGDWLIGEDVYTPQTPGDALRSMSNPAAYGQPGHMDDYVVTGSDNGGVHINSGIPNKALHLAASDIGRTKAAKIWWRANRFHFTSNTDFDDARAHLVTAATELYGAGSNEKASIEDAWADVGVGSPSGGGGGGGGFEDTYEPNDTFNQAYGPISMGTPLDSYIADGSDKDTYRISVPSSGTLRITLTSVPKDYDLYVYDGQIALVGKSTAGGTNNETVEASVGAGTYYARVVGYNGASSQTDPYTLTATHTPSGGGGGGGGGGTTVYPSSDTPIAIPDNYGPGINSYITVPDGTVAEVNVSVNISHTWKGDLRVWVFSPDGTKIQLHNKTGGNQDNLITTYDTFTVPVQSLGAFNGKDAEGSWRLRVSDNAGQDTGTLNSWSLEITTEGGGGGGGTVTVTSGDLPKAIPDNTSSGVSTFLPVTQAGTVLGVTVSVNVSHTYKGDLRITVYAPSGQWVILHYYQGGSANNVITTYPTQTTPYQSLSAFQGASLAGTWRIKVQDNAAQDVGTFQSATLQIDVE